MNDRHYRGRIAPSPTGFLHLGHAKTFWTAFRRCRDAGGTLVYRDEDIDAQRCKSIFSQAALEDLSQLGISWQEGPISQSTRLELYEAALKTLVMEGLVYPCHHSRKTIRESSAGRTAPNGEVLFPVELRSQCPKPDKPIDLKINWRFRVPERRALWFRDKNLGTQTLTSGTDFGDFLVWRKDGMPSYELAVVVDDADMDITEVVRGEDLLISTGRQLLLYEAFGHSPPEFYHETLVKDERGQRLAKRNHSLALRTLFEKGHTIETIRQMWLQQS